MRWRLRAGLVAAAGVLAAGGFYAQSCIAPTDEPLAATALLLNVNPLAGAIFTTVEDGSRVNANIYEDKADVYLDGGPGPGAPAGAAGLAEGDYLFQVTDPSGKTLLSADHPSCRRFHVSAEGVIDHAYPGTNYEWQRSWQPVPCRHVQGVDRDHAALGAITVQLMPYDDTPNRGGVYKAWVTPVEEYLGDLDWVPERRNDAVNGADVPEGFHGFLPAASKTDNYKVKGRRPVEPMTLSVRKFHDRDGDGSREAGEEEVGGWRIGISDPLGASNNYYTPVSIVAQAGTYLTVEDTPAGTLQTVAYLDGVQGSVLPHADPIVSVIFQGDPGETHEVLYGDVGLGSIAVCKTFDRDADGTVDAGEPPVARWRVELTGTTLAGDVVGPLVRATDEEGCVVFADLFPGDYRVAEVLPPEGAWRTTGDEAQSVAVTSSLDGAVISATSTRVDFTNVCTLLADFDTKGYWHNKNGLAELTAADIEHVNGLVPYASASTYFGAGDEPFDGAFADGSPVSASLGESGETIAPAGSSRAEISVFLVDANADGDPREQLAQQLLAFVFNVRRRLGGVGALIGLPDGTFRDADDLVADAIAAWQTGTAAEQRALATLLDALNNSDALPHVPASPCTVAYP